MGRLVHGSFGRSREAGGCRPSFTCVSDQTRQLSNDSHPVPMPPANTPDEHRLRRVDALFLRLIASAQGLLSLSWLVMTPFMFNYGGAAANPTGFALWNLFWLSGLVIAICLFSVRLWARLLALAWNAAVLWWVVAWLFSQRGPNREGRLLVEVCATVTGYLLITAGSLLAAIYGRSRNRAESRRRILYVTAAVVGAVIAARWGYVESHAQGALEAKLGSASEETRCSAAKELATQGRAAATTLPKLVALLGTTSCYQWGGDQLPKYIEEIGGVDEFYPLMKSGDSLVARTAAGNLMYGTHQNVNQSRLIAAYRDGLHNGDARVREVSALALGGFRFQRTRLAPDLIRSLNDPDASVRAVAAASLERLGSFDGFQAVLASADSGVHGVAVDWQERRARGDTAGAPRFPWP